MKPGLLAVAPGWGWRAAGDVALAVVLLVMGLAEIWAALPSRTGSGSPVWTSVAVVTCTLPLVWRRSQPLPVVAVIALAQAPLYLFAPLYVLFYGTFVPIVVATFSVARHGRGREPLYGVVLVSVVLAIFSVAVPGQHTFGSIVFNAGGVGIAWAVGWALTRFEHRAIEARRHAVETDVAAARLAMEAVIDERTRIARELHDIVAHAVSVIVVQAGAAEPIVEEDPAFVRQALGTIRTTGASALADMRRVVAMLRDAGEDPELLTPQPGISALPDLVEHARRSGLDTSLAVEGAPEQMPIGLELAVYRIVQEALSNVRRHSCASRAWVVLTYQPDRLDLEIRDNGVGTGAGGGSAAASGHGLIGMRERAAMYGGRLETSAAQGRGFTVQATLPLATP